MRCAWVRAVASVILSRAAPVAADDFRQNAGLGGGQPESCGEALDLSAKAGGGIDDEDGGGRPVDIEDRRRAVGGERDDVGEKRRASFAAAKLKGAANIAFGPSGPRSCARERVQAMGERRGHGRKLPAFIPQARLTPHEVLGLGVGEEDPAIPGQDKDGETGGRGERVRCCSRPGKQGMDRGRALQMRRERFQEVPFPGFHPNRIGRSCKGNYALDIGLTRCRLLATGRRDAGAL